jgi:hypothetical protein
MERPDGCSAALFPRFADDLFGGPKRPNAARRKAAAIEARGSPAAFILSIVIGGRRRNSRAPARSAAAPPARLLLLGRQPWIGFDPIGGGDGKPGLRGGDGRAIGLTGLHVQPRLAVGDMSARQAADPSDGEESHAAPNRSDRQTAFIPWGKPAAGMRLTFGHGLRPPSVGLPRRILILIVA